MLSAGTAFNKIYLAVFKLTKKMTRLLLKSGLVDCISILLEE